MSKFSIVSHSGSQAGSGRKISNTNLILLIFRYTVHTIKVYFNVRQSILCLFWCLYLFNQQINMKTAESVSLWHKQLRVSKRKISYPNVLFFTNRKIWIQVYHFWCPVHWSCIPCDLQKTEFLERETWISSNSIQPKKLLSILHGELSHFDNKFQKYLSRQKPSTESCNSHNSFDIRPDKDSSTQITLWYSRVLPNCKACEVKWLFYKRQKGIWTQIQKINNKPKSEFMF